MQTDNYISVKEYNEMSKYKRLANTNEKNATLKQPQPVIEATHKQVYNISSSFSP